MRISRLAQLTGIAAAAVIATLGGANAGTVYTDRTAWEAAISGETTIDFQGIAPQFGAQHELTGSVTVGGVNFALGSDSAANNGSLYVIGNNLYYTNNSVLSSQDSNTVNDIIITLPGLYTAIGLDFADFTGGVTTTFSDATAGHNAGSLTETSSTQFSFFGYIAGPNQAPIDAFEISQPFNGFVLNIDNVSFGQRLATATPEPVTLALFGAGLAGAAAMRRRSRKKG